MRGRLGAVACSLLAAMSDATAAERVRERRWSDTEYVLHLMSYEWPEWTEPLWDRFRAGLRASYGSLTPRELAERREVTLDLTAAGVVGFRYDHVRIDTPEDHRDDHLARLGARIRPWLWLYLVGDTRADKRFAHVGGGLLLRGERAFLDLAVAAVNVFFESKGTGEERRDRTPVDLRLEAGAELGAAGRALLRLMMLTPFRVDAADGSARESRLTSRLDLWWSIAVAARTELAFHYRWLQRGEREDAGALVALDYETAVHTFDVLARGRFGVGERYELEGGVRVRLEWEIQPALRQYGYGRTEVIPHAAFGGRPAAGLWLRARWLGAAHDIRRRGEGPLLLRGLESKLSLEVEYRFGRAGALRLVGSFDTDPASFGEFDGGALVLVLGL